MYVELITNGINKALHDELTSVLLYQNMSEYLVGVSIDEFRKEMAIHADEEMTHFKKILAYAHAHGISPVISMDCEKSNEVARDFASATSSVQMLEMEAINLYESLAKLAKDHDDIETYHFFKELMEEEQEHFDDVAKFTGEVRNLYRFDKSIEAMSFDDYLEVTSK